MIGLSRGPSQLPHDAYEHFQVDMANESALRQVFSEIGIKHGTITNLINNAGISSLNHSLLMPMDLAKRIFEVNFFATFVACQEAARLMQKQKLGRIVNFSSAAVGTACEGLSAYASSKAAVEQLTKILAREFQPFGITVNAIAPGVVETDLTANVSEIHKKKSTTMKEVIVAVDTCLNGDCSGQVFRLF